MEKFFYKKIGGTQMLDTYMFSQTVVIATEAEDEVAGLSDVDAVSDVLEQEGEAFPSG